MPTGTAQRTPPAPHLEDARAASRATFARRRKEKAIAELLAQGNTVTVIGPDGTATTFRP
jgi:hypothetical protein